ncbi:retinol-binding protein pinta [Aethina tumida]|uniref:retinol-binding protein pinta n=1 Tax=Aethina tumida TaxID=116153 RepID=UPI0021473141|nr:retinol-binding protein pinta [Aethina tumida]
MTGANKYVFPFDDKAKQFAEEHLNETEENREAALKSIKQWIQDNSHLNARTEDEHILPFLRGCKFNLDKTKQKITNFYTMKRDRPEWFENRDPSLPELQELVRLGVFVPLRQLHDNKLVVIIKTAAHDPRRHKQDDVFKVGKMILDVACMECEIASVYGVVAIFDMTGVSLAHARQLPPRVIKKAVFAWQNYHCRPKQLEFVNAPVYINVVLNVFKSFMSEKLKGRVKVHFKGFEDLHKSVDKNILPEEYGGCGEDLADLRQYWEKKLVEYTEWFVEDGKYKAE